jgi:L-arabinonolactonase
METIVNLNNQLGECVLWCERTGRVWWTDILGSTLFAHHLDSGQTSSWAMPERLASFALTEDGNRLLLGLASRLAFFDFSTGEVTMIAQVEPGLPTRLNDGRCDRNGNFVFGTLHEEEPKAAIGAFYRLNAADLSLERLALRPVAIANSICFSPDGATMVYCDSPDQTIRCCDYPSLQNDRAFAATQGEGVPDGSCVDADGFLWNAQWGDAKLVRYAPDGSVDCVIAVPATQPTCVAFGGPGLDVLLCSSATVGLAAPGAQDGALFASRMAGVKGLPESRFAMNGASIQGKRYD